MKKLALTLALSTLAASPAFAQVSPLNATTNSVRLVFTGVVTNDVTNTIMLRQPDGSFTKFTGPVPDYPYKVGDTIAVSFNTVLPNKNFYEQPQFAGQKSADGIYKFNLVGPAGATNNLGVIQGTDVTGPISPGGFAPVSIRGLTVVYDANQDGYSLALPTDEWSLVGLNYPNYLYNPNTNQFTNTGQGCVGTLCEPGGFIRGNATNATVASTVSGNIVFGSSLFPEIAGFFSGLSLGSASWNLPQYNAGNPTEVPEPGMVILFGAGATALLRRRRKAAAKN